MTIIADTRLPLTEFPPNEEVATKVEDFFEKDRKTTTCALIVITEFIKYAGVRIGEEAARTRLRLSKRRD